VPLKGNLQLAARSFGNFGIEGSEMVPYAGFTRHVPDGLNDCRGLFL